jgi:hypothetical protein
MNSTMLPRFASLSPSSRFGENPKNKGNKRKVKVLPTPLGPMTKAPPRGSTEVIRLLGLDLLVPALTKYMLRNWYFASSLVSIVLSKTRFGGCI